MKKILKAVLNRLLAIMLPLRAKLVLAGAEEGMTLDELAEHSGLTEDEVERILWWERSKRGEVNGGWLS